MSDLNIHNALISRRRLLTMGIAAVTSAMVPNALAAAGSLMERERSLSFYNLYTGESLSSVYWHDGKYLSDAMAEISFILRDIRTGKVKPIDRNLLDLLANVQSELECNEPFHIISGYRTPKSNALLGKKKKGVAKNSLHMYGKAIDVRVPGYSLKNLRLAAMNLKRGGVGYYPKSRFVHMDVGQVRYWWG